MPDVFISYRRADTAGYASWLHDRLVSRLGAEHVFIDVDAIPLGVDFVDHVKQAVGACDVTIVLIGNRWQTAGAPGGESRLDDPEDVVRLEVAAGLACDDVRVLPVLVDGASMPPADALPEEIRAISRHSALVLSAQHRNADLEKLLGAIESGAKRSPSQQRVSSAAERNVALVQRIFAAFNAHDAERAAADFDRDIEFDLSRSRSPYHGVYRGLAAVRHFWESFWDAWDEVQWVPDAFIPVGRDLVVVPNWVQGIGRASGLEIDARGAQLWQIRDGKAILCRLYQDVAEAFEAARGQ